MQPTPAEVARTLAAGHLPAVAHVACGPGPLPVRHVTDANGQVLLLSPRDGTLATALRPQPGTDDTAMVLDISDVPPMAGSPSLGRVWVSGWATLLEGDQQRQAALDYAGIDASGDLLDVGAGQVLHRMNVAEVRYERHENLIDIDPDAFCAAGPDPLRHIEFDLIADLVDHHEAEMSAYVRRQLGSRFQPEAEPRVVRMDRYGLLVRLDDRLARLAFPRPVTDRHDLAHLLHPVLCARCGG
nr:DUF2470 domain-containing protein [uncultured Actinoplanes sp.]